MTFVDMAHIVTQTITTVGYGDFEVEDQFRFFLIFYCPLVIVWFAWISEQIGECFDQLSYSSSSFGQIVDEDGESEDEDGFNREQEETDDFTGEEDAVGPTFRTSQASAASNTSKRRPIRYLLHRCIFTYMT